MKLHWMDIVLIIILYFIGNYVGAFFFLPARFFHFSTFYMLPVAMIATYAFIYIIYYIIAVKPRSQSIKFNFSFRQIQLFPLLLFVFAGINIISELATGLIPTEGGKLGELYEQMTHNLLGNFNKYPLINTFIIVVLAPILEEMFFRGFILKGLLNNKVQPYLAIVVSAAIFGGVHLYPWQVIGAFLMGLVLGLAFYKTGSIMPGLILHVFNNILGIYMFKRYGNLKTPEIFHTNTYTILAIGITVFIISGYLYIKLTKNNTWKSY